ncbi:hypothetical protein [Sphingomonas desiccabilis]|uniref:Uncharacterized protein n=1 Tax=Sphingomonas desiccabilis TaxID=429134 RepID=A0A4Q2IUY0_9SPHN|nr:hypothetical protein [Sphingomonas desiccabilis]MBB3909494.1 hypothetical protein [Sphingomonas desiccabilis]RXZ34226.1 hypothetical protein EO081_00480 [Sphingomonas desiccabilis]
MLPILLLLAVVADTPDAPPIHDGGICAGLSWVHLAPGEKISVERGPDFKVFRFHGPASESDHWWGVYFGNAAQVRGNGPLLLRRNGVTVRRATEDGQFRGYLAKKGGWQNHFFGSVFNGSDKDRDFFDRIDFSSKGQALCAKG